MKYIRIPAILLLILYSSLVVGMNFHSHDRDQQVSVHCKICDFSQTFATQPAHVPPAIGIHTLGVVLALEQRAHTPALSLPTSSRSPPLA